MKGMIFTLVTLVVVVFLIWGIWMSWEWLRNYGERRKKRRIK